MRFLFQVDFAEASPLLGWEPGPTRCAHCDVPMQQLVQLDQHDFDNAYFGAGALGLTQVHHCRFDDSLLVTRAPLR